MDRLKMYDSLKCFTPVRIEVVWEYDLHNENEIIIHIRKILKEDKIVINGFIYCEQTIDKKRVRLNSLASIIWELCDAVNSIQDIMIYVSKKYSEIEKDRIEKDVFTLLDSLHEAKCINMYWKPWN